MMSTYSTKLTSLLTKLSEISVSGIRKGMGAAGDFLTNKLAAAKHTEPELAPIRVQSEVHNSRRGGQDSV